MSCRFRMRPYTLEMELVIVLVEGAGNVALKPCERCIEPVPPAKPRPHRDRRRDPSKHPVLVLTVLLCGARYPPSTGGPTVAVQTMRCTITWLALFSSLRARHRGERTHCARHLRRRRCRQGFLQAPLPSSVHVNEQPPRPRAGGKWLRERRSDRAGA